jgi:hypothetical protein
MAIIFFVVGETRCQGGARRLLRIEDAAGKRTRPDSGIYSFRQILLINEKCQVNGD